MESILHNLPHVCVYIDDILVTGKSGEEHVRTLDEVLTRLKAAGLRLKREKCSFMLSSAEYLGHSISAEGHRPTQEKVRAILNAPAPQNISQLWSFLGLVNCYARFLPNLSSTLAPLYSLLQKNATWCWKDTQEQVFQIAKKQLSSPKFLVHYDPQKELILSCDASPYGIGEVLSQRCEQGLERLVAFASRTLSPAEKSYVQLEKEGLAIVFGVKEFHQYLFGRTFQILSDHKPLQHLFSETRPVPPLASSRIQRWALILSAYNYTITYMYKPGAGQARADSLSRLPLPQVPQEVPIPKEIVCLMQTLQGSPVTATHIEKWTDRDPVLSACQIHVFGATWLERRYGRGVYPIQQTTHRAVSSRRMCVMGQPSSSATSREKADP